MKRYEFIANIGNRELFTIRGYNHKLIFLITSLLMVIIICMYHNDFINNHCLLHNVFQV